MICVVQLQVQLYQHVLRGKTIAALMSARSDEPSEGVLGVITTLRKLCNHPNLLRSTSGTTCCHNFHPLHQLQDFPTAVL